MSKLTEQQILELINITTEQLEELDYETSMQRLEVVVETLEQEGMPLELGLKLYELGKLLSKKCSSTLDAAEDGMMQLLGDIRNQTEAMFDPEKDGK